MKSTIMFVAALGLVVISACGDDDSGAATENPDAGSRNDSGAGSAGRGGSSSAGRGGSTASAGSDGRADGSAGSNTTEDAGSTPVPDAATTADGGDSGTGTTADAAVSDAGGDAGQPDPGCAGLEECCALLPEAQRMSCQLIADNADDALCTDFQPLLCAPPVEDKKACKTLDACCDGLPRGSLKVSCAMTVMAGVPLACQQSAIAFCPSEGGDPNVCEALSECCGSLIPPQRASCNMVVAQALPAACETVRAALCP